MSYGVRPVFRMLDLTQNPEPKRVTEHVESITKEMLETPAYLSKRRTKLLQEVQRCNRWLKINNADN